MLPWLEQLAAVKDRSEHAPARHVLPDDLESFQQRRDHVALFILQVGKGGRAVVVAEEIQAKAQLPVKRVTHDLGHPRRVAARNGDGQVRRVPQLDQLMDSRIDEPERGLAAHKRPLDIVLLTNAVQRDHHPDLLRLEHLHKRCRQRHAVAEQRRLQAQPALAGLALGVFVHRQQVPGVQTGLAARVFELDPLESVGLR
jgi:hypothetical protein